MMGEELLCRVDVSEYLEERGIDLNKKLSTKDDKKGMLTAMQAFPSCNSASTLDNIKDCAEILNKPNQILDNGYTDVTLPEKMVSLALFGALNLILKKFNKACVQFDVLQFDGNKLNFKQDILLADGYYLHAISLKSPLDSEIVIEVNKDGKGLCVGKDGKFL